MRLPIQLVSFLGMGAVGFVIESIILQVGVVVLGYNIYIIMFVAFFFAVSVTWLLNRRYTFKVEKEKTVNEWLLYSFVNTIGGCIHLAVYAALVYFFSVLQQYPILPLFVSAAAAAMFNYLLSHHIVFKQQ